MTGFEPLIAALSTLVIDTVKESAKKESGNSFAKFLNKDIGKALEQQVYNASGEYYKQYCNRHGTLKVVCVRMDNPISLEDTYTDVQLLDRAALSQFESTEGLQEQFRQLNRRSLGSEKVEKQDGIAVANEQRYLMVLGGPGVGKSTFLRKVGLEALKGKRGTYEHPCVPVFLALQRFKGGDRTLTQRIVEEFAICGFPEPEAVAQALLKQGKLLLLLDGLDEVPQAQEDDVINQIRDFVDQHSHNRFIASCRIAAYKGGFPRFKDVAMAPFDDAQIEQYIQNWFRSEKDQENDTASQCWKLLQRPDYAAAKELAQTPLLLTLLCATYDDYQDLPKKRASLYAESLDVVLRKWASEKRIHDEPIYREFPIELERQLLADIAYDNFVEDQLFFNKQDITRRIRAFLVSNLNAPNHLDSEAVLSAIEVQQGILVERARDVYSFSHLTFQEYLTAQSIVDNQQTEWLITNRLADEHWREVFLLVASLTPGRNGANNLLLQMEQQIQTYLNTPRINALLRWADTATAGSEGEYLPAAKRAGAIVLIRALIHALNIVSFSLNLAPARNYARHIDRAIALDLALCIDINMAFDPDPDRAITLVLTLDLALAQALDYTFARDFERIKVFKSANFLILTTQLEGMRADLPEEISKERHREIIERIYQAWMTALQLDADTAQLTKDETAQLEKYFYASELMVRCKEAATRVSPEVWTQIEARMVTASAAE